MVIVKILLIIIISTNILATTTEKVHRFFPWPSNGNNFSQWPGRRNAASLKATTSKIRKDYLRMEGELSNEFNTGSFYWYGRDTDGTPTLWYRVDRMEWDNIVFHKRMQYTDLVLKSILQNMPGAPGYGDANCSSHKSLNFVLLLDDFSPMQMLKHPKIGPAFLRSFIKTCPGDCLKRAVMVTGTTGHVFYNIVKGVASKNFVDKISVVKSREAAALMLVDKGIVGSKGEVPTFLGGSFVHKDSIAKSLSGMVSSCFE